VVAPAEPAAPAARRWSPRRGLGLLVALLLVVVIAVLLTNGGGSEPLQAPPAGGTVAKQLDQLDDSIDHARR
jgi:hypothetical protein